MTRPGSIQRTTECFARVAAWAAPSFLLLIGCGVGGERVSVDTERVRGGCRVVGGDSVSGERALAACASAAEQLTRILGMTAPPGVILLASDSTTSDADVPRGAGEMWALAIPRDGASPERLDLGAGRQMSAEGYLTHETAHRIAHAMLFPPGEEAPVETGLSYGSPLPDWLDEALGQLTEPEADRRARLAPLSEGSIIYALPLRRFLYMPHPALQGVPAGAPLRRVFYGQSLAFALFLHERGGADGFRGFVRAIRSGQTQGVALTSIPGLPGDGGDLEAAWLAWLRDRQSPETSPPRLVATSVPRAHAMTYVNRAPDRRRIAASASMAGAVPHRRALSRRWLPDEGPTTLRRNA